MLDRGAYDKALSFVQNSPPATVFPLQQSALKVRVLMLCREFELAGETALTATQTDNLDATRKDERAALFFLHYVLAVLAGDTTAVEFCKAAAISLAEEQPATLSIFGFK